MRAPILAVLLALISITAARSVEPPAVLDLGAAERPAEVLSASFTVRNATDAQQEYHFYSACPCVTVRPRSSLLAAGESTEIDVRFDTEGYAGTVEKRLYVKSTDDEWSDRMISIAAELPGADEPDGSAGGGGPGGSVPSATGGGSDGVKSSAAPDDEECAVCSSLDEVLAEQEAASSVREQWVVLDVYSSPGCRECEEFIRDTVPAVERRLERPVSVRSHSLLEPDGYETLLRRASGLGVEVSEVPVVFVGSEALQGTDELTAERLVEVIGHADRVAQERAGDNGGRDTQARRPARPDGAGPPGNGRRAEAAGTTPVPLAALPVFAAGLLDGINPCAFAAIVFLITLLAVSGKSRSEIVTVGAIFAATVFVVYLLVGIGAMSALRSLSTFGIVALAIRWTMVLALGVLAALSFVDARRVALSGPTAMMLKLPGTIRERINRQMRSGLRSGSLVIGTIVMASLVSIFELACTGQIYLPTIIYVIQRGQAASGLGFLVLYNVAFIIPLLLVFLLFLLGVDRAQISGFLQRNAVWIKIALGLLFLMFAALLALT